MKNRSLWIRTGIIIAIALLAVFMVFGPSYKIFQKSETTGSITSSDFTWEGIKKNLNENINLGLDLKGGSHLLIRVKTEDYLKNLTNGNKDASVNTAKDLKIEVGEPQVAAENGTYSVSISVTDPAKTEELLKAISDKRVFDLNYWNQSTSGNTLTWTLPPQAQKNLVIQATDLVKTIIDGRINTLGVKEPNSVKIGAPDSGRILLQMPGVDDPERVKDIIGKDAKLELMKVVGATNPSLMTTYPTKEAALQSIGGKETSDQKVFPVVEKEDKATDKTNPQDNQPKSWVVVQSPAIVDGSELREARPISRTGNESDFQIEFFLKPGGAAKFGDWTSKNIGAYMAVVLDGQVKSAPYIKSRIDDQGQIDGRFTRQSADDLVLVLKSGALPAQLEYQEERTVGPSLGADSIDAGLKASLGGLIFVMIFMLIYYRGSGVNAVIALILNMLLTVAGLIWFKATLTLPGIAGLILGIGMAVDSNVLIFERIREEFRAGKTVQQAVDLGFDRAFVTIIDTHITTIISSLILFFFGTSLIKGFAVTLILGLAINLFTAVFVSRTIFMWLLSRKAETQKLSI